MSLENILISLGVSLSLTLILELVFALTFKVRNQSLLIVIFANILTNPAVVMLHLLLCRYCAFPEVPVVLVSEISAIILEWLIYSHCTDIKKPFLFSLAANAFSYSCGLLAGALI